MIWIIGQEIRLTILHLTLILYFSLDFTCLAGATNIVKDSYKNKYVYAGYGIAFAVAGSWSFGNEFVRNVVIYGVDNSLSSHTDNGKSNFLMLGEVPTDDMNGSVGTAEKKFSINFRKEKFFLSLHYNGDSYLLVHEKSLNLVINIQTFLLKFVKDAKSKEVSFKGNVCGFSVSYNLIVKSEMFHIHKYLNS